MSGHLHAACTRLTLLTGPAEFSLVRIKCVMTEKRLKVDAPRSYAALPVQPPQTYHVDTTVEGVGGVREEASFML